MSVVRTALRRPYTVLVLVAEVLLAVRRMPADVFPPLGVPTIYVAQPYAGMDASQMEGFPHLFLRVPLSLHHGYPLRRSEVDPRHGFDYALARAVGVIHR
ncbi:MAG: hypothetical protein ACYCVV_20740 [Acidimicrobiales bacterium]